MPLVKCEALACKHNKNNMCTSKAIQIIGTDKLNKIEDYADFLDCKTFEPVEVINDEFKT